MRDAAFEQAFADQNRRDQISNSTLATILSIALAPAGAIMDAVVYPSKVWTFLELRVCSSVLVGFFWLFFMSRYGKRHYKLFGVMWYMCPVVMIELLIYLSNDREAPYYAGVNIVLLALGLLSPWTYRQNLFSAIVVIGLYLVASYSMPKSPTLAASVNNLYFLITTATIVVFGSRAHYKQRYREFELRWELDNSRRAVEEAHRKLQELDEAKSRFFANISHELRTPLTLLIAPLENLVRRFGNGVDEDTRNLLGTMHANGMRLLKLINDLLDLVRLESGAMVVKRESLDLADFSKGLISAVRQVADDKHIRLETYIDPALGLVMLDRDKLEKIILNLLFNALKFTPAGGKVELRAEKRENNFLLIIRDTGVGISEKNLPNVFSRFWQADDSSRRKYQGVGIGLALVKELTELQGGAVSVASAQGQGTTFSVRLPYEQAQTLTGTPDEDNGGLIEFNPDGSRNTGGTITSQEWLSN
ncbi:MAG TPA: HAMP domain-containing sensor histidine kinase, partial [Candidatus Saccharimonadales bacterium]|nr:HAMP domain-containing sensor histidine kinase [Candidatus Saccharimonadales bacterium]